MTTDRPDRAGVCPFCGAAIAPSRVLIEYEAGGERRVFAECPDCRDVVDPHARAVDGRSAGARDD